jgi:hypothetical protein
MRERKPRNAALEFAKAFTYLVAQEGCRQGKGRTLDARKFEKWARAIIRRAGGDPDKIGESVGQKLHWLVFNQKARWQMDLDFCVRRGRAMAWRHKILIAEQVLTDGGAFGLSSKGERAKRRRKRAARSVRGSS